MSKTSWEQKTNNAVNQKSPNNSDKISWSRLSLTSQPFLYLFRSGKDDQRFDRFKFNFMFLFTLMRIWSRLCWISLKQSRTWRRAGASSMLTSLSRRSSSLSSSAIELFLCHTGLPLSANPKVTQYIHATTQNKFKQRKKTLFFKTKSQVR